MGFYPAEDPEIVVLVMLDEPYMDNPYGSVIAAPIVKNILADVLPYMGYEPIYTAEEAGTVTVPDLVGAPRGTAQSDLISLGLKARMVGEGETVVLQVPESGYSMEKGGTVLLYTEEESLTGTVTVPNVIGYTGKQANTVLLAAGLNIKITGAVADGSKTVVVNQSPMEGESLQLGGVVTVEIAIQNETP